MTSDNAAALVSAAEEGEAMKRLRKSASPRDITMILRAAFLAVGWLWYVPLANAAEKVWSCTYPGLNAGDQPILVQYRKNGNLLTEYPFDTTLRIVRDDTDALTAAAGDSSTDPQTNALLVSVYTVTIDKRTHKSLWLSAFVDGGININSHGTCVGG